MQKKASDISLFWMHRKLMVHPKKGERYFIILDAPQAYGARGYADLVKPNEQVFYNIEIMDIRAM
jgi:FKBP-type peptidyl-prolyl cis-trans isomerase